MEEIKIIGINGSPFVDGKTSYFLKRVLKKAESLNAKSEIIHLSEKRINLPTGRLGVNYEDENTHDDMREIYQKLINADAIIIASPTHWFNVSSLVKIFIDRLTVLEESGYLLEGKVGGFIAWSPDGGGTNALASMALPLNQMGLVIPPYALMYFTSENNEWAPDLELMAQNIIKQIKAQKSANISWDF